MTTRAPSAGAPTLPLWPGEEDVELPFTDDREPATLAAIDLGAETIRLRRALVDALGHIEAGTAPHGSRIRAWRELAGTAYVDNLTPTERAEDGIARAAARWTDEETARVDAAIRTVAARRVATLNSHLIDGAREFTTADVWAELGDGFPVTKGIAGRMASAKAAGVIESTGRTTIISADAPGPNHGQRLTVWRAL